MRQHKILITIVAAIFTLDVFVWYLVIEAPPATASSSQLYFLNVGQGDSELVDFGAAQVLIDGGPDGKVLDNLSQILPLDDRYIDLLVMTHPQLDHFGGFIDVLENYRVGAVVVNGRRADIAAYKTFADLVKEKNVSVVVVEAGDRIRYGDNVFEILNPTPTTVLSKELNDGSIVLKLPTPNFSALYTGDIGENIEKELVKKYDLAADILKVPHHGSRFSSSERFLAEVNPKVSVVEVGKNTYGHPTPAAMNRIKEIGSLLFTTQTEGLLKATLEGGKIAIFGE